MNLQKNEDGNYVVWEFLYNPMYHESGYITMSIHLTKEGAKRAMQNHRRSARRKWNKEAKARLLEGEEPILDFGQFEHWMINEMEVKE